jgi:hypothetical protein
VAESATVVSFKPTEDVLVLGASIAAGDVTAALDIAHAAPPEINATTMAIKMLTVRTRPRTTSPVTSKPYDVRFPKSNLYPTSHAFDERDSGPIFASGNGRVLCRTPAAS